MDIPDTTNVHQLPEIKQEDPGEAARLSAFMAEESDVNWTYKCGTYCKST